MRVYLVSLTKVFALFLWYALVARTKAKGCKIVNFLPVKADSYLANHVIETFACKTKSTCQVKCYVSDSCMSYNYHEQNAVCDINDSDQIKHPNDLIRKTGNIHVSTKNACQSKPCPDNGTCQAIFIGERSGFNCLCPSGFTGPSCNEEVILVATACEGGVLSMSCPNGNLLRIKWALYGRSSKDVCLHRLMKVPCGDEASSLIKVKELCEGKQSCSFTVGFGTFGIDPCPGFYKYTEVKYACQSL